MKIILEHQPAMLMHFIFELQKYKNLLINRFLIKPKTKPYRSFEIYVTENIMEYRLKIKNCSYPVQINFEL